MIEPRSIMLLWAIGLSITIFLSLAIFEVLRRQLMEDFSKLNSSIGKLQTDVGILIASKSQSNQAAIDAAQAAVDSVDAAVVAATPPPTV